MRSRVRELSSSFLPRASSVPASSPAQKGSRGSTVTSLAGYLFKNDMCRPLCLQKFAKAADIKVHSTPCVAISQRIYFPEFVREHLLNTTLILQSYHRNKIDQPHAGRGGLLGLSTRRSHCLI